MSFTAKERQAATMIGHLEREGVGSQTWTGHITGLGGETLLLKGRVEQVNGRARLVLLATYGQTPDQKRLRREEKGM